jgi:tRNA modification GTPase
MTETLAARLTPPGTGAIATIGIRGPSAWQIVRRLFRPRGVGATPLPESPERGEIWIGRFGEQEFDEVVLNGRGDGANCTVEVLCHGGKQVVDLLLEAVARQGARICDMAEYLLSIRPHDRWDALAEQRLLLAPTARTAALLLQQRDGRVRLHLEAILQFLERGSTQMAADSLCKMASNAQLGRHLIDPWQVTVAGAPNVGKSSLVNALVGYQRSVVSPTPGTTRDVVTTTLALDGWPVELADTAGLRQDAGALEGQGIERARTAASSADLCLWVLDASAEPVWPDFHRERILLVVNKMDLPSAWGVSRADGAVLVSARTGAGISALCDAIVRRLVPRVPEPSEVVPFTAELCDAIEQAYAHFTAGRIDETRQMLRKLL